MEVIKFQEQAVVIQIIFFLLGGWLCLMLAQRFIPAIAEKISGRYRFYILGTVPVLRLLIIILAAWLIISRIIEPNFENLIALLGAIGIALGFAFKDYLSSLIKAYPVDPRDQFTFTSDLTVRGKAALVQEGMHFATAPVPFGGDAWPH